MFDASEGIQTPDPPELPLEVETRDDDDLVRKRQYRVGLNLFNMDPERGLAYLWNKKFLDYSPAAVAKFLLGRKGPSRAKIGKYLCSLRRPFNLAAFSCFVQQFGFAGLHLDIALRKLQQEVALPKELQMIEQFVKVFSKRYIHCNQMFAAGFRSGDTVFVLTYAILLLNTDLHSKALHPSKRMKWQDFMQNL
jgi:IQ motif/SEC7 domain-containing protein